LEPKRKKMIKASLIVLIALVTGTTATAQYYYDDVINNKQVRAELAVLKDKKVKGVKVVSMEANGEATEGFTCQKKINRDFTEVEIYTDTKESYPNTFISYFDKAGLLLKTVDSSEAGATATDYAYDAAGRLLSVNSSKHFATDDDAGVVAEQHIYKYNNAGILQQMFLVQNNRDTTAFVFEADENGNVIIEKNEKTSEVYYYYYDEKNRLTDIVHKYSYQKTLFTENSFEYNEEGQLAKMVTSEKEGAYYFTWRYDYENGLRITERCYSKEGSIVGSVEYKYK
jgi:YD repeat-containing protein